MKALLIVLGIVLFVSVMDWLIGIVADNFATPITALFFGAMFFFMIRSIYRDGRK